MHRQQFVAGNWKMNGSLATNRQLIAPLLEAMPGLAGLDVAVCVPFPYLEQVGGLLRDSALQLGAQDVSAHAVGAFTGDVAASMLREFDCQFVIVGHSERRVMHGESDYLVAEKYCAVCGAGMVPILCVGEVLAERERGATLEVVSRQLEAVLDKVGAGGMANAVLAYEPVWAIGTGKTATPEEAQEVHRALREVVARRDGQVAAGLRIIYGGSVKPENALELFAQPDIDGGLVGGASLNVKDFLAICQAAKV